jgi:DNA mismatch endonuclease (patch repair protein)
MDIVGAKTRSRMMSGIRGKNTRPELPVRHSAHALGYRFGLHRRDLSGTPDLVFPRLGVVVMVRGCFWHRHEGCKYCTSPSSNSTFWQAKFRRTTERDRTVMDALRSAAWHVVTIWECQASDQNGLTALPDQCLGSRR